MNYLLDTCVVSELVAKKPNPRVVEWVDQVEEARLCLSVITIGEIRKGIDQLADSRRKSTLRAWLDGQLLVRFGERIVPIDVPIMLRWGELMAALEAKGKTMSAMDSLLAATALSRSLDLVTRNEDDFEHTGLAVVNPWG